MTKTKYPPSKIRYLRANPNITFNIPVELKNKIEELCKSKGVSKAQLVKTFFLDMTTAHDDLKQKHVSELDNLKKIHIAEMEKAKKELVQKGAAAEKILKDKYDTEIAAMRTELIRLENKCKLEREAIISNHKKEIDQVFERGYNMARNEYEIKFYCKVCGEAISITPNSNTHEAVVRYMRQNGWAHSTCHR